VLPKRYDLLLAVLWFVVAWPPSRDEKESTVIATFPADTL